MMKQKLHNIDLLKRLSGIICIRFVWILSHNYTTYFIFLNPNNTFTIELHPLTAEIDASAINSEEEIKMVNRAQIMRTTN